MSWVLAAGQTVGAVAGVGRGPVLLGEADQRVGEAVMVEIAVHHRREPDDGGAHALLAERDRVVRRVDPGTALGLVVLGAGATGDPGHGEHQRAAGRDERLVGADQGLANRPGGCQVGVDRAHEVAGTHRLVLEGEMDDAVGLSGSGRQTVEVVEVAAADLGAHAPQRPRPKRRSGRGRRPGGRC